MNHPFAPFGAGSAVVELLAGNRLPELGPGTPNSEAKPLLQSLTAELLVGGQPITDHDMARCCLAGLWLHHDFLDESHAISQEIHTSTGSYWHAIMHRREPDAANSKYWWRRVGSHPVLETLIKESPAVGYQFTDPMAFVDHCERVRGTGTREERVAMHVQLLEWEHLFHYCGRKALGR